ncbi:hypothetical protein DFH09DRAFT_1504513 [Mycena vulgaris]|nr:hypothetical protein DFH09DRAFT_1504513 [Mycena vulgaris]
MKAFPNELLFEIFSQSLIATRGVCKLWHRLSVHADIDPARRDLLMLYDSFVSSPAYATTREWSLENLRPFDRQAYVDALLDQHNYLPDHFRLWILEWPDWAIIGCVWPGLPPIKCNMDGLAVGNYGWVGSGCNTLGHPPSVYTIEFELLDDAGEEFDMEYPALLIWQDDWSTWLFLDGPPDFRGRIFTFNGQRYCEESTDCFGLGNWVEWLTMRLKQAESLLQLRRQMRGTSTPPSEYIPLADQSPVPCVRFREPWSEKHTNGRTALGNSGSEPTFTNLPRARSGPIIEVLLAESLNMLETPLETNSLPANELDIPPTDPWSSALQTTHTLPDRFILELLPLLCLKSLIAAQGVCRLWNYLVRIADIDPARFAILVLYKETIRSPLFIATRPWMMHYFRGFDRKAFVESLLEQHNYVPEDFCLWILEWPARAIMFSPWPGLPEYPLGGGHNILGCAIPLVETVHLDLDQLDDSDEANHWRTTDLEDYSGGSNTEESSFFDAQDFSRTLVDLPALRLLGGSNGDQTWLVLDRESSPFDGYVVPGSSYVRGQSA